VSPISQSDFPAGCDVKTRAAKHNNKKLPPARGAPISTLSAPTVSPGISPNQPASSKPYSQQLDCRAPDWFLQNSSIISGKKKPHRCRSSTGRHTRALEGLKGSARESETDINHEVVVTGQRWFGLRQIIQAWEASWGELRHDPSDRGAGGRDCHAGSTGERAMWGREASRRPPYSHRDGHAASCLLVCRGEHDHNMHATYMHHFPFSANEESFLPYLCTSVEKREVCPRTCVFSQYLADSRADAAKHTTEKPLPINKSLSPSCCVVVFCRYFARRSGHRK